MSDLRDEIVQAIIEGAGNNFESVDVMDNVTCIWVKGHLPIQVLDDDVILPKSLEQWAPGIRLDVQAILANEKFRVV